MDINSFVIGYKKGKASGGGGGSGGDIELNIAYGDTPPEDTTKLWVKTTQPSGVVVSSDVEYGGSEQGSAELLDHELSVAFGGAGHCVYNDMIYTFGGSINGNGTKAVYKCNPLDGTATLVSNLATALYERPAIRCGKFVYLFGGGTFGTTTRHNTIYQFDLETNAGTTLTATIPLKLSNIGGVLYDGGIYLFGGKGSSVKNTVYRFDPETLTVTTMSVTLPVACYDCCAIELNGYIYIVQGTEGAVGNTAIYRYDVANGVIEQVATRTLTRWDGAVITIGNKIYTVGGKLSSSSYTTTIECYDTDENEVQDLTISIQTDFIDGAYGTIKDKLYMIGGNRGNTSLKTIMSFTPPSTDVLVENEKLFIHNKGDNKFSIINNNSSRFDIGVEAVYKGNTEGIGEEVKAALYKDGVWVTI